MLDIKILPIRTIQDFYNETKRQLDIRNILFDRIKVDVTLDNTDIDYSVKVEGTGKSEGWAFARNPTEAIEKAIKQIAGFEKEQSDIEISNPNTTTNDN